VDGVKLRRAPFLKGQTALGELGLKYQSPDSGLTVDVGGWGGYGNQKIGGGSLTIGFAF